MSIKNDIIANDEYCRTSGLQKVLYDLRDVLEILCFHKFHKVDVLSHPFLLRCLIYNVLLFFLYSFFDIVCHMLFVSQGFLLYDLVSISPLFFLIMACFFCGILFFHHDDILDFADIALVDILPNIFCNKGRAGYEVSFCILDKFSYKNNSMNLLIMQGYI